MSKFDSVRKKVKRRTNKLHLLYVFLFVVFISVTSIVFMSEQQHNKELESILEKYKVTEEKLGEKLLTTLLEKKQYETYFDSLPFGNPIKKVIVNSVYGWRFHPVDSCYKYHNGIDLKAKMNTPIYAVGSGKVIFSSWKYGYGKVIILQHPFHNRSLYAHLNKSLVVDGQNVVKGDKIGLSGRSGKVSGPHLHYEIRLKNKSINPFEYLQISSLNIEY